MATTNDYKVRLIAVSSLISGTNSTTASQVTFEVSPSSFSESGEVEYETISPVHMPGGVQVYRRTASRKWSIAARFISRTSVEATQNLIYLQTLRGWRMPYFGVKSSTVLNASQPKPLTDHQRAVLAVQRGQTEGIELLGAPPDVLYLYAYSTGKNDKRDINFGVNINRVPVVLTSLDFSYLDDVDYLPTISNSTSATGPYDNTSEPFPMKMEVNLSLLETHSPTEYEQFSLSAYKQGKLKNF